MVDSGLVAVRQAAIADLGALVPLFDAYRSFYGRPSDPDAAGRFLADRLERRQSVVFLAEDSGSALGFTQLYPSFSSVRLARILVLNDLFVAPGARGRGVATLLLGAARDHARRAARGDSDALDRDRQRRRSVALRTDGLGTAGGLRRIRVAARVGLTGGGMGDVDALLTEIAAHWEHISAERVARRRTEAPGFNVFDFLRDDEYGLSSVVAWMLDPAASHGQGDVFLGLFLRTFGIPIQLDGKPVVVTMESATHLLETSARRMDIHVRIGGSVLAIENKPWARWQRDQVRAYLQHIAAEATEAHCLVLVRGYGDGLPESQLTAAERADLIELGQLVDGEYPDLRTWALACANACEAPRVGMMLGEFADMIAASFGIGRMTTDEERLAYHVLQGGNVDAALRLMAATDAVLARLVDRCHGRIVELAGDLLDVGPERPDPLARHGGFVFELDRDAPFTFCVEFDGLRLSSPYLGLKLREGATTKRPLPEIKTALESAGVEAGMAEWVWIWWNWAEGGQFGLGETDVATTWQAMADGSFARMSVDAALRIDRGLREAGVLPWATWRVGTS